MTHKDVAVVVPVYRFPLLSEEEISLRHLLHYLGKQELVLVAPESLKIEHPSLGALRVERFADDFFQDLSGYNRLMLSRTFYERFQDFKYVLVYQLDCLVFSSDLATWCERGWDYAGAPWFKGFEDDTGEGLWATGNGGLSLRHVSKFLEVLRSRKYGPAGPTKVSLPGGLQRAFLRAKDLAYACGYKSKVNYVVKNYTWNEDGFWSFEARHFADGFVVPAPEAALPFVFEHSPQACYELNGRKLPFGCHAWYKIDPDFWRPFLLPG